MSNFPNVIPQTASKEHEITPRATPKNYYFEFTTQLSDFGALKKQIQPAYTLEHIEYKFPKRSAILELAFSTDTEIKCTGVCSSTKEPTELHEGFKGLFLSVDKEAKFSSKWKLLSGDKENFDATFDQG